MGRAEQLAFLEEELERAAAGEFRCVLVLGEPGVGKSRLAGELVARHRGALTGLAAHAHSLGATTAFGVWAEALERHLRSLPAAEVERLCADAADCGADLRKRLTTFPDDSRRFSRSCGLSADWRRTVTVTRNRTQPEADESRLPAADATASARASTSNMLARAASPSGGSVKSPQCRT